MPTAEELRAQLAEAEAAEAQEKADAEKPQNIQEWIDNHEARLVELERRLNGGAAS
jgi:macrodomain Ter protein organizer (MatP/YcbG family)